MGQHVRTDCQHVLSRELDAELRYFADTARQCGTVRATIGTCCFLLESITC